MKYAEIAICAVLAMAATGRDASPAGRWAMDDNAANATVSDKTANHHGKFIDWTGDPNTNSHHRGDCREGVGALAFDGIDDHVQISGHRGITGAAARTCMAWIKTPDTGRQSAILSWGGRHWIFGVSDTGELMVDVGGPSVRTTRLVNDDQWHHVAATLSGVGSPDIGKIKLYVDGVLQKTVITPGEIDTPLDNDMLIGAFMRSGTPSGFFKGLLDDIRIYDDVRSSEEIYSTSRLTDDLNVSVQEWLTRQKELYDDDVTGNEKGDGYYGIWYFNTREGNEYQFKYSGGLGTYCCKHMPFAIYAPQADKTFFCYGGTRTDTNTHLVHMVSYYDHKTGMVPRPTILLDKLTDDAHDNPVISIDDEGYVWIFSTSHGITRPSYIHKSKKPYDIEAFELVKAMRQSEDGPIPFINFSYFQVWHVSGKGFFCFLTLYTPDWQRAPYFIASADGVNWGLPVCLSVMGKGSYQISHANAGKIAVAFDYHPPKEGLNFRTNLYYLESVDDGKTWQTADGKAVDLPLRTPENAALVYDAESKRRSVYLKDLQFDSENRPVVLFLTTEGWQCGPQNGPRTWEIARWDGDKWAVVPAFDSDNNYDHGSLFIEKDQWRIVAPTAVGPQAFNTGGEMVMWSSVNRGQTWNQVRQMTVNSPRNHTYARGSVNAHPGFDAFWADGNAREESISNLYFSDREGNVYLLPRTMKSEFGKPIKVEPGKIR